MAAEITELQFNDMPCYRGIRDQRYTYVKKIDGPWMMFDNELDPLQK